MTPEERDLDPDDWATFEEAARRVLGELVEFVRTVDDRSVWRKPSDRAVGELIAGFVNANVAGRRQAPVLVEGQESQYHLSSAS